MSGEAILSAENSGKLLGGRASQLALPQTPYIAGGIKVAAPPKEPLSAFGLGGPMKNPGHAGGTIGSTFHQ